MSSNLFVGMDVHKDSISVACFESTGNAPIDTLRIANEERRLRPPFRRWQERGYQIGACLPGERGRLGDPPAAEVLGHPLRRDRSLADPEAAWRAAQAGQA
jgi:hypothetical protein